MPLHEDVSKKGFEKFYDVIEGRIDRQDRETRGFVQMQVFGSSPPILVREHSSRIFVFASVRVVVSRGKRSFVGQFQKDREEADRANIQ